MKSQHLRVVVTIVALVCAWGCEEGKPVMTEVPPFEPRLTGDLMPPGFEWVDWNESNHWREFNRRYPRTTGDEIMMIIVSGFPPEAGSLRQLSTVFDRNSGKLTEMTFQYDEARTKRAIDRDNLCLDLDAQYRAAYKTDGGAYAKMGRREAELEGMDIEEYHDYKAGRVVQYRWCAGIEDLRSVVRMSCAWDANGVAVSYHWEKRGNEWCHEVYQVPLESTEPHQR